MLHDPDLHLYDRACDLLDAAQQLADAAGVDGTAPSAAGTLGCLEVTLDTLAHAVDALGEEASDHLRRDRAGDRAETARRIGTLSAALAFATQAAAEARDVIGPAVHRATMSNALREPVSPAAR